MVYRAGCWVPHRTTRGSVFQLGYASGVGGRVQIKGNGYWPVGGGPRGLTACVVLSVCVCVGVWVWLVCVCRICVARLVI